MRNITTPIPLSLSSFDVKLDALTSLTLTGRDLGRREPRKGKRERRAKYLYVHLKVRDCVCE